MLQVKAFTGGGFKLGSESQPSVAVGQPAAGGPSAAAGPRKFILKMWQVGTCRAVFRNRISEKVGYRTELTGGPPEVGPRKFILKMWQVRSVSEPVPRVRHGSPRVKHGSVGSVSGCCKAASSSNLGSAPQWRPSTGGWRRTPCRRSKEIHPQNVAGEQCFGTSSSSGFGRVQLFDQ